MKRGRYKLKKQNIIKIESLYLKVKEKSVKDGKRNI